MAETLRSAEAQIGRAFWVAYFGALEHREASERRTRRPAEDPLNAMINYGYGMLYGEVESAALTAGLDPHIGFLHRDEDPEYLEGLASPASCLMRSNRFALGWTG